MHPRLPYTVADILWAVRNEYCMTVEDALARRTRALLLDAAAALEMAPEVARVMADEMKLDQQWQQTQVEQFNKVARQYLPKL
jgi:glycerol-3-phosphate dehydrogenase